jgi:hypothetical protein
VDRYRRSAILLQTAATSWPDGLAVAGLERAVERVGRDSREL